MAGCGGLMLPRGAQGEVREGKESLSKGLPLPHGLTWKRIPKELMQAGPDT